MWCVGPNSKRQLPKVWKRLRAFVATASLIEA